MDIHHLTAVLGSVTSTLNSRPLGLDTSQEDDTIPITPGDLLTGRPGHSFSQVDSQSPILSDEETLAYVNQMKLSKVAIFDSWRAEWLKKVFPTLLTRNKWQLTSPNLAIGDLGMLQYEAKFGADTWKLAKITAVFPDQNQVVRTVEVQLGLKKGQHGGSAHRLVVPVQRFSPLNSVNNLTND
jgi:hypothetical protein